MAPLKGFSKVLVTFEQCEPLCLLNPFPLLLMGVPTPPPLCFHGHVKHRGLSCIKKSRAQLCPGSVSCLRMDGCPESLKLKLWCCQLGSSELRTRRLFTSEIRGSDSRGRIGCSERKLGHRLSCVLQNLQAEFPQAVWRTFSFALRWKKKPHWHQ